MEAALGEILLYVFEELDMDEFEKCKFHLRNNKWIMGMQKKVNRSELAAIMKKKFGVSNALDKIIKICKKMNLNDLIQNLKTKIAKVEKKYEKTKKKPVTKKKGAQMKRKAPSDNNKTGNTQMTKEKKLESTDKSKNGDAVKTEPEAERKGGRQIQPLVMKVIKVNQPFEYDTKEGKKNMFHATVANECEFIRVKVLNSSFKEHFIKEKIIKISKGYWCHGLLQVNSSSWVQDVDANQEITVPQNIIRRASKTPKIQSLLNIKKYEIGSYVYGVYEIYKKNETDACTFFKVKDDTGYIDVVAFGKWAKIKCEKGDKLRLTCFELSSFNNETQLKTVPHSYIKVIKAKKNQKTDQK